MLIQRFLRACVPAVALAALTASFTSCSSAGASGAGDAGDDHVAIDLDSTLPPAEASTCDPCSQRCPCSPGDYFYNPARCGNEYCTNGVWGGVSCTVGPGCPESAATCPMTVPCGPLDDSGVPEMFCPDNDYCLETLDDGGTTTYACVEVCTCSTTMTTGCAFGCFGSSAAVGFSLPAGCTCSPPDASTHEAVTVTCGEAATADAGADAPSDAGGDEQAQPVADAAGE